MFRITKDEYDIGYRTGSVVLAYTRQKYENSFAVCFNNSLKSDILWGAKKCFR